jgi:hypothetical protein
VSETNFDQCESAHVPAGTHSNSTRTDLNGNYREHKQLVALRTWNTALHVPFTALCCAPFSRGFRKRLAPETQIKRVVGEANVDRVEMLHQEVMMLLEIWRDYRSETDTVVKTQASAEVSDRPRPRHAPTHRTRTCCFPAYTQIHKA